jgi:8-oxo-dGTP pyrophosphatase MutT (NUDIX family)
MDVLQAGAIAVKGHGPTAEVLIVRAKKNPRDWIFPKGHIEAGETAAEAAARELREEAGVAGEVLGPVGESTFRSGDEQIKVTYFLVRFLRNAPAEEQRAVRWLPFREARALLTFDDARSLLDKAETSLALEQKPQ